MALPNSVDASAPAGGDSPSLGDDQLRALKLFIEDIFSIPDATSITNAGIDYQTDGTIRYPRRQELGKGGDIASATAVTVGLDGNYFDITGVANITSFSSVQAGAIQILQFDDACTITHNVTSMILAGLANQIWAAGDMLALISEGGGNWRELWRKGPLAGRVLNLTAATNQIVLDSDGSSTGTITMAALGASRTWTFPNTTGTVVLTGDNLSVFAATTSAQLAGVISDETGSGALVFANSPTLIIPELGTPASGVLTNCTGTAAGLTAGNVTTNANLTGPITSVGNATSVASQTGTGSTFVMNTSPTLVTPLLGTPASGVLTNCTGLPQASVVGLTTADSPQFAGLNIGHASDTTITRVSAGVIAVEGNNVALVSNDLSVFSATTSAQLAGVISDETGSGALVFATAPTLSTGALVTMGTGSGTATVVGVANVNTTSQATTGTSKETLASYSLPANSLSANGKAIRIRAWGITAANGNTKTFTIDFGATTVATNVDNSGAGTAMVVVLEAVIIRTGANTQEASGFGLLGEDSSSARKTTQTRTTPSATDSGAITIAITGTTPTAIGDLTFKGMTVEFLN